MTNREKRERLGNQIWNAVKTELLLAMPFLAPALSELSVRPELSTTTVGTDAKDVLYNPDYIFRTYVENPSRVNRTYLHMLLHCLFGHMYREPKYEDIELWNLSCDIAVEHILDSMDYQCIYRVSSDLRDRWYADLKEEIKVFTAEKLYNYFSEHEIDVDDMDRLIREFIYDDHGFWERLQDDPSKNDKNQENMPKNPDIQMPLRMRKANKKEREDFWKDTAKRIKSDLASIGDEKSTESGSLKFYLQVFVADKTYYTEFLDRIAVIREELRVDPDSFDYGMYQYGMELYGNMPLIEENEYCESNKIDELVIAIDTSASCSDELVQTFLNETAGILRRSENFFRQIHVHIIECDNRIQKDILIKHPEEMEEYAKNFEVSGGYGTDFRPVFEYVDEERRKGKLKNLRGLMYFTDGFGDYPAKETDYDTAFVYPSDSEADTEHMPEWAISLYI